MTRPWQCPYRDLVVYSSFYNSNITMVNHSKKGFWESQRKFYSKIKQEFWEVKESF